MYRSYLDQFIPIARDDDWILSVWRESNTAHPVSVRVILEERERAGERGREREKERVHMSIHITNFSVSEGAGL